jgi:hypothetical protein
MLVWYNKYRVNRENKTLLIEESTSMKRHIVVPISLIIMSLTACSSPAPNSSPLASPLSPIATPRVTFSSPEIRITPLPDKAAMQGRVIVSSGLTQTPLGNMVVRLAKVYWNADKSDGAVVLDGAASPGAITNEEGEFFFSSIEAADYAVVIGDAEASSITVSKPDGSAKVFTTVIGQVLDVGVLEVPRAP